MFNKDVKVPLQEAELVGTSSSNIYFLSCLIASWTNVEDFVDAKCRCNLVNWESCNFVNWESTEILRFPKHFLVYGNFWESFFPTRLVACLVACVRMDF